MFEQGRSVMQCVWVYFVCLSVKCEVEYLSHYYAAVQLCHIVCISETVFSIVVYGDQFTIEWYLFENTFK